MNHCEGDVCGITGETRHDMERHRLNMKLHDYRVKRKGLYSNRDGAYVSCYVAGHSLEDNIRKKIIITVKPNGGEVEFKFKIKNETNKYDMAIIGISLLHPQHHFQMNKNPFEHGKEPYVLAKKTQITEAVSVKFVTTDIGQYDMPIIFTFRMEKESKKELVIIRDMVVRVEDNPAIIDKVKTPYRIEKDVWNKKDDFYPAQKEKREHSFKVPKALKYLLPHGLDEQCLSKLPAQLVDEYRIVLNETRTILDTSITEENYMLFFRHLLWWEEIVARINLKRYNMSRVTLELNGRWFKLEVPGLSEKRPSLLNGDFVFIRPLDMDEVYTFEGYIKEIQENHILIDGIDERFHSLYSAEAFYNVRFIMSRHALECMHAAVSRVLDDNHLARVFPNPVAKNVKLKQIRRFYNPLIEENEEQRCAVQHILSQSSGIAPYLVFGPPGTGKTVTIVEAIVQIVVNKCKHRVWVCADSNTAADHIALQLLRYNLHLGVSHYLFRANSVTRTWEAMPPELVEFSNGSSRESFYPVSADDLSKYRVVVTTLIHASKYATRTKVSHLFIDEAAQALEPACLVPVTGLLAPAGQLVLAGDPQQLGPVCLGKKAKSIGLGTSLMERLYKSHKRLYSSETQPKHRYITMLVKNFRSNPDILQIPNQLFYENKLEALAAADPLSTTNIIGEKGNRAIVFHAINSMEQKLGNSPSYFNERELDMLKRYLLSLINDHQVSPKDIGVIAPYMRQVQKARCWLKQQNYEEVEVGSVEAFQGKEKRVILISTVRAQCKLVLEDAKFGIGFLTDKKRFNVAVTRAKAKLIIIGNPICLTTDEIWKMYMEKCKEYDTYIGMENEQLPRTLGLLSTIVDDNFRMCRIQDALQELQKNKETDTNKKKNTAASNKRNK